MTYKLTNMAAEIWGEGALAGRRAVVLRFQGCDLWQGDIRARDQGRARCAHWCDANFVDGQDIELTTMLAAMNQQLPRHRDEERWTIWTGGEPTMQLDWDTIKAIKAEGWKIAVETNGASDPHYKTFSAVETAPLLDRVDHLICSPKRGCDLARREAHELRVVLPGGDGTKDPGWTDKELEALEEAGNWGTLWVQPCDPILRGHTDSSYLRGKVELVSQYKQAVTRCKDFIRTHPNWRLSLQTQKLVP